MAVTHSVAVRNAIATAVVSLVDQGSGFAAGRLVIFDALGNVISTQSFSAPPSFNAPVNGSAQALAITVDNAPTVGAIPASYQVQDRNGNMVFEGTCGPTGDLGCPSAPLTTSASTSNFAYNAPP